MQTGVEPLWRVRRNALAGQHVGKLVTEGERIFFGREIFALPAPVGPCTGQTVKHLARIGFRAVTLIFRQFLQGLLVGNRTPQERRNVVFFNLLEELWNSGLAEILLRQNVGRNLAELRGNVDIRQTENNRTIRVLDFADGLAEVDVRIRRLAWLREAAFNAHCVRSSSNWRPSRGRNNPVRPRVSLARSRVLPI